MRLVVCLWIALAAVLLGSVPARAVTEYFPSKATAYSNCVGDYQSWQGVPGIYPMALGTNSACVWDYQGFQCLLWYAEPPKPEYQGSWITCGLPNTEHYDPQENPLDGADGDGALGDCKGNCGPPVTPYCINGQCFNPINTAIGNKYQREGDVAGPGPGFERHYNSYFAKRTRQGLGPMWTHTYSRRVVAWSYSGTNYADVARPDGSWLTFTKVGSVWTAPATTGRLLDVRDGSGNLIGWRYSEDGGISDFVFDAAGRLASFEAPGAGSLSFSYSTTLTLPARAPWPGLLLVVTDAMGRTLELSYDDDGNIDLVTTADGDIAYGYDVRQNLETVTYPDASVRTYVYGESAHGAANFPFALTGIVDENSNRFATFEYDTYGRAVVSEHAGGADRGEVAYGSGTATITEPGGAETTLTFSVAAGRAVVSSGERTCVGCTPRETTATFDGNGWPNVFTAPDGVITDYDYDAAGRLTRIAEGSVTLGPGGCPANSTWYPGDYGTGCGAGGSCWALAPFSGSTEGTAIGYPGQYYSCKLPTATPAERTTETDWHTSLRLPTERRVYDVALTLMAKSTWTYNSRGQVLTANQIDPGTLATRTTTYAYCESTDVSATNSTCPILGLPKTVDGPLSGNNDTTTFVYRSATDLTGCATPGTGSCHRMGDLWKVVDGFGHESVIARYDLAGRVAEVVDANGVVSRMAYDTRGRMITRTVFGANAGSSTDDAVTTIDYDDLGQVEKMTQPDGAFVEFTYDEAHRLERVEDGLGNSIEYSLDAAGNIFQEDTRDAGNTVRRTLSRLFDDLGQLETLADAAANATDFAYDANGDVDTVTDALGRITDHGYDTLGRLRETIANTTGSGAERAVSQFDYDVLDRLTEVVDPKGLTTAYDYDGLGNLVELDSPDTGTTTYDYDAAGNRTEVMDARGVQSIYSYDRLSRLTTIDRPTAGQDVALTWDAAPGVCQTGETFAIGRLGTLSDASGDTQYCYDRHGNTVRKVQTVTGATATRSVLYGYDLADNVVAMTYPSGATVSYTRDATGRITGVSAQPTSGAASVTIVSDIDYLPFGPANVITFGNGRTLTKAYDQDYGIDAVTDSATGGLSIDLGLDDVGNVTAIDERLTTGATAARTVTYDGLDRLTALKNGGTALQSFAYDATGNRTNAGASNPYTYESNSHRLTQVNSTSRTNDVVGNTTGYGARGFGYDDANRLTRYLVSGVLSTEYAHNGHGQRVSKTWPATPSNNTYFVYDEAGHLIGEYLSNGARFREYVWVDDTLVAVLNTHAGTTHQYVLTDHLSTPRAVVLPTNNAIAWRWDLTGSAFGEHAVDQNPDGDANQYILPLRYPGQYHDPETAHYYNYFRDYDPATGRYLQSDPVGLAGGISTFGYVGGQPLLFTDAFGLNRTRAQNYNFTFDPITTSRVQSTIREIQVINPNYRYRTHQPPNARGYNRQDYTNVRRDFDALRAEFPNSCPSGGTYVLRHPTTMEVMRTGRTNDLLRREIEHGRDPVLSGFLFQPVHRTDSYAAQRGLEQLIYNQYPGAPNNHARPISPTNRSQGTYMRAAEAHLLGGD